MDTMSLVEKILLDVYPGWMCQWLALFPYETSYTACLSVNWQSLGND